MGRQNERRGRLVSFRKIAHVLGQLCFAGREALVAYDLSLSQKNQYIAILIVWHMDQRQAGHLLLDPIKDLMPGSRERQEPGKAIV